MLNNAMSVVILAAGKGTHVFRSSESAAYPCRKTMVQHVIDAANELGAAHVHRCTVTAAIC